MKFFKSLAFALPLFAAFAIAAPAVEQREVAVVEDRQLPQIPITTALQGVLDKVNALNGAFTLFPQATKVIPALTEITAILNQLKTQLPDLAAPQNPTQAANLVTEIVDSIIVQVRKITALASRTPAVGTAVSQLDGALNGVLGGLSGSLGSGLLQTVRGLLGGLLGFIGGLLGGNLLSTLPLSLNTIRAA